MNCRRGNEGVLGCPCSSSSVLSKADTDDCNLAAASFIFTRTGQDSNNSGFGSKCKISSISDSICLKSVTRLRFNGTSCW